MKTIIPKTFKLLLIQNGWDAQISLPDTEGFSFVLHQVPNFSTAMGQMEREKYDVVLLDLALTGKAGLETLRQVQDFAPQVPVVVLVKPDDEALGSRAMERGAR